MNIQKLNLVSWNVQQCHCRVERKDGKEINTLTANYEYSRSNRENLPWPIQIKLSKKP